MEPRAAPCPKAIAVALRGSPWENGWIDLYELRYKVERLEWEPCSRTLKSRRPKTNRVVSPIRRYHLSSPLLGVRVPEARIALIKLGSR